MSTKASVTPCKIMTESQTAEDKTAPHRGQTSRSCSPLKPRHKRNSKVFSCTDCSLRKQKVRNYRSAAGFSTDYMQCDRSSPCSNCFVRNKQSACHYKDKSASKDQLLKESTNLSLDDGESFWVINLKSKPIAQVSSFSFAKPNGNNNTTLRIFRKIWNHATDPPFFLPKFSFDNNR
jgi:hypothetical protein